MTTPQDPLETINQFRTGTIRLKAFLDTSVAQISALAEHPVLDLGALEDFWMGIEIIDALAAEAQQATLDPAQTQDVEEAIDGLAETLAAAL